MSETMRRARAPIMAMVLLGMTACHRIPIQSTESMELPRCAVPRREGLRVYLVFFDQHSAAMSHRGIQVTEEFADLVADYGDAVVRLLSHKDASEVLPRDRGLDTRRGEAVARLLRERGIPNDAIIRIVAKGTSHPLVPTPALASEPQNRNVEFMFESGRQARPFPWQKECREWLLTHRCDARAGEARTKVCESVEKAANWSPG